MHLEGEMGSATNQYSRGAACSLQQLKWEAELHLSRAIEAFNGLIVLPSAGVDKYGQSSSDFIDDKSSDSSLDSDSEDSDW